jgi:hypothetical protein
MMEMTEIRVREDHDPRSCYVCPDQNTMKVSIRGRIYTTTLFLCDVHFNRMRQDFGMSEER